jgi:hypothetical protein
VVHVRLENRPGRPTKPPAATVRGGTPEASESVQLGRQGPGQCQQQEYDDNDQPIDVVSGSGHGSPHRRLKPTRGPGGRKKAGAFLEEKGTAV